MIKGFRWKDNAEGMLTSDNSPAAYFSIYLIEDIFMLVMISVFIVFIKIIEIAKTEIRTALLMCRLLGGTLLFLTGNAGEQAMQNVPSMKVHQKIL